MPNQTLVSVPTKFQEFKQVRAFAVKLVEKLDVVLGYRGTIGYEEQGTAEALVEVTLASLATDFDAFKLSIDSIDEAIILLQEDVSIIQETLEALKTGVAITDTNYSAPTVSVTYTQAEVQGIADTLETVSDKLDTLFGALRSAEIID